MRGQAKITLLCPLGFFASFTPFALLNDIFNI